MGNQHRNFSSRRTFIDYNSATPWGDGIVRPLRKLWGTTVHVGALQYVRGYCTERVVIVKVNPKDVVSVPRDHNAQKVRVCEYEVMREYTGNVHQELERAGYTADGEEYEREVPVPDDYEDYDDDPCADCWDDCEECEHYDL